MTNTFKTSTMTNTLAAVAAAIAMTGAAYANETPTVDSAAVLESITAQIDADKARNVEMISSTAEARVAALMAKADQAETASERFALAHN